MATHNDTGKNGEERAQAHLRKSGYEILETNYRYGKAEIDIIARKNNTLAIVEVKTRSSDVFGAPEHFVNPKKIRLILEATNAYVSQNNLNLEISLDIISILLAPHIRIEHIKNAYLPFNR